MGTILCGVDESPGAAEALRVASGLSKDLRLRLVLAHVAHGYRLPEGAAGVSGAQAQQAAERLLARLAAAHGLDGQSDRRAEVGEPARELARIASEEAATVIVVGARIPGRWRRPLLTGLAAELNATAPCPVVIVPPAARL